ncbi:hypothetical protein [Burkholderia cepacia]|uniref:hypothetical protein n=1 Tax=Burkholderia cepacia TaxID=292 RepID=UPI002AB7092F|nr:hypothetical protein [Burkholderia cepacia]
MVFMFALVILLYANGIAAFRLQRRGDGRYLQVALHLVAAIVGAQAFLLGLLDKVRPVLPNHNVSVPLFAAAGLLTALVFAWKARGVVHSGDDGRAGWRLGVSLVAMSSGLYIAGTTADHCWFFLGDSAGIVAVDYLHMSDAPCSGYALMRLDGDIATYRCPALLAFGSLMADPFVPWPGYVQGQSKEMKQAFDKMMSEAQMKPD